MTNTIDYALLAGNSYYDTRNAINRLPTPHGWTLILRVPSDDTTGFEAVAFKNGTEIVISFAGTANDGDWSHGNIPLGLGKLSDQLRQASDYYLKIKNDPANVGATISFTGHSLGSHKGSETFRFSELSQ